MLFNLIRFLSVIFLITFASHYFLFFSWCRFFDIHSLTTKRYLLLILFFLSITFILSSIFIHMTNHPLTRTYYLVSATWMGLMSFLLFATALVWILKGGLYFFPQDLQVKPITQGVSCLLYGLAVMYTGYCHYQFYKIKITPIHVPVQNLPQQWQDKKIIHLSDLHLGGINHLRYLKKVVNLTNEQDADLILITGDLFDGATNFHPKYIPGLNNFKAKHGTFFTSGNHEIYSGIKKSRNVIEKSNITLLDDKAVVIKGLQILGISYPEFKNTSFFDFDDPRQFIKDLPTILLYHTPTSIKGYDAGPSVVKSSDYFAPDTTFSDTIQKNISLQLSGHTHAGQFFPFTWVAGKVFKGLHYGLHKIDNFHINISAGTGSWGPPLRSGYLSEIVVITLVKPE